jgi:transposase-like protein
MDNTIAEAELVVVKSEIKDVLNRGFKVCCPHCHEQDYEIYPTGQLGKTIQRPEEDLHWVCRCCGYIWNSEFLGVRYQFRKSCLTGQFHLRYGKSNGFFQKFRRWLKL